MLRLSRRQDLSREKKSFSLKHLLTMGIPSAFLMGVSVICVRRRRQFRVRTDLVQCDVDTVQYKLFNFGVNKFISGVNSYNLGVNIYSHSVNQVSERVCCLLVLNLVSSTLPCIRQPGPRLDV